MYLNWHSCDEMLRLADKNDRLDLTLPKNADGDVARHEVCVSLSVSVSVSVSMSVSVSVSVCACVCACV